MTTLLDEVQGLFTPDILSKTAVSLGENESGIKKAISGVIPTVLGEISSKASKVEGAKTILDMARSASTGDGPAHIGDFFGGGGSVLAGGMDMAKRLLGDTAGGIAHSIAGYAGIKETSASSLIGMVTPVALGVLGHQASAEHLNPPGLSNLLAGQKSSILSALPSGLSSLKGKLGLGGSGPSTSFVAPGVKHAGEKAERVKAAAKRGLGFGWLLAAIVVILAIYLIWYFMMSGRGRQVPASPAVNTGAATLTTIKVTLPDGKTLEAYKGGIEDRLVTFLNSTDPADSISNARWFDFNELTFKTGSADITDESKRQVRNIAAILLEYPKVKIKIGGYTDKTGNEEDNLRLSRQRAEATVNALKQEGVDPSQLVGAEGYGSQFARAAAAAPEEERKADRRISVSVRSK